MSDDTFFILPDAAAGDARSELLIAIDGKVNTIDADTIGKMIFELHRLAEWLDGWARDKGCEAGNPDGGSAWSCEHCQAIEWLNRVDRILDKAEAQP